jgi:hypothetical protein
VATAVSWRPPFRGDRRFVATAVSWRPPFRGGRRPWSPPFGWKIADSGGSAALFAADPPETPITLHVSDGDAA